MRPSLVIEAAALLLAAGAAGCATKSAPMAQLERSTLAVRIAEGGGAAGVPIAREHLQLAQKQLADARELIDDGEYERAHFVLIRAEADASAARSVAHAAKAKMEAERTLEAVAAERERVRRAGGPRS